MKLSGIYQIQSKCKPERFYIGSSFYINRRWWKHLRDLELNKHHSIKLQRHYNKYGKSDLQFSVLLICSKDSLIRIEQYFIDYYDPWFNECKFAYSCLGVKRSEETLKKMRLSQKGRIVTEEVKQKISKSLFGRHLSKEHSKNISKSLIGNKRSLGRINSELTKQRMSISQQKRPPCSEATKLKRSKSLKGWNLRKLQKAI